MKQRGVCLGCKEDFTYCTTNQAGKYCSNACQQDYQTKTRLSKAIALKSFIGYGCPAKIKKYAIRLWGHKCVICCLDTWIDKKIPLVLDHIDGNSDNWAFDNLRLICCNCDAQTSTYKGKNRGNGRHLRRQRYAEGKSY